MLSKLMGTIESQSSRIAQLEHALGCGTKAPGDAVNMVERNRSVNRSLNRNRITSPCIVMPENKTTFDLLSLSRSNSGNIGGSPFLSVLRNGAARPPSPFSDLL